MDVHGETSSFVHLYQTERGDVGRWEVGAQETFSLGGPEVLIAWPKAEVQLIVDAEGPRVDWPNDELIKWTELLENCLLQQRSMEFRSWMSVKQS